MVSAACEIILDVRQAQRVLTGTHAKMVCVKETKSTRIVMLQTRVRPALHVKHGLQNVRLQSVRNVMHRHQYMMQGVNSNAFRAFAEVTIIAPTTVIVAVLRHVPVIIHA